MLLHFFFPVNSDLGPAHAHPLQYRAHELRRTDHDFHRSIRLRLSQRQHASFESDHTREHHVCHLWRRFRHRMGRQHQSTRTTASRLETPRQPHLEPPDACLRNRKWERGDSVCDADKFHFGAHDHLAQ